MKETVLTVIQETEILGKKINLYRDIDMPLFEASEIAGWIGIKNVSQMLKQAGITDGQKGIFLKYTLGGNQKSLFITEDAMYDVLMRSRKKEAKIFNDKIKEYLTSIRRTGAAIEEGREEEMIAKYFPSFSKETQAEMVNDLIRQNKAYKEQLSVLMETEGLSSMNVVAKECEIGLKRLFSFLRTNNIMFYKDDVNVPYQRFMDSGLFKVKETICQDGKTHSATYATKKGLLYIQKLLRKNGYYDTVTQ